MIRLIETMFSYIGFQTFRAAIPEHGRISSTCQTKGAEYRMLNWTKMRIAICACCLIVTATGCQKSGERSPEASMLAAPVATPAAITNVTSTNNSDPVFAGAGDVASCDDLAGAKATAKLLDSIPGTVFVAGDLAYPDGSAEQFTNC